MSLFPSPRNEREEFYNNTDKFLKDGMKSMAKVMLPFWIIGGAISIGALIGIIYFIGWVIHHFHLFGS